MIETRIVIPEGCASREAVRFARQTDRPRRGPTGATRERILRLLRLRGA